VASAKSVSVLIDAVSHKPMALTPGIVAAFQPWLRRGVEITQPKF
jgi:acyl-CoA thioester hydrolase